MPVQSAKKIYPNKKNEGYITCPHCRLYVVVQVSKAKRSSGLLEIKCSCGMISHIVLGKRKYHRKRTKLSGMYINGESRNNSGNVVIENVSFGGIRFKTQAQHNIEVDDTIQVRFALDEDYRTVITEQVRVSHVRGCDIGAKFVDTNAFNKSLAIYLMS